jgi:hypothetical protein
MRSLDSQLIPFCRKVRNPPVVEGDRNRYHFTQLQALIDFMKH